MKQGFDNLVKYTYNEQETTGSFSSSDIHKKIDKNIIDFMCEYKKSKQAIEVNFRELVDWVPYSDSYTHYVHTYPAKLLKHIPIFFLNSSFLLPGKNNNILDPFCGSGTVLLESLLSGHNSYGCDANPLAMVNSKSKNNKSKYRRIK